MKHIPRIFVSDLLFKDKVVSFSEDITHHLLNVMRIEDNSLVKLFNKNSGEWLSTCLVQRKKILATCNQKIGTFQQLCIPQIILVFPLINPTRMHFILEKCTEIGVVKFIPLITDFSQYSSINLSKAQKIIISSVEQCGRIDIPDIDVPIKLSSFLDNLDENALYLVANMEGNSLNQIKGIVSRNNYKKIYVIVGPEGGFSSNELCHFENNSNVILVKLGNYIMRSETACFSGILGVNFIVSS